MSRLEELQKLNKLLLEDMPEYRPQAKSFPQNEDTEMAHIFRQTEDGLYLTSRFWLGKTLKNPLLRKAILTEDTARGMAEHCCVEYRNLTEILPVLYGLNEKTD